MSIQNLQERVAKLERQSGGEPIVLRVVYKETVASDEVLGNAKKLEVLSPEEEAVLQKHQEDLVAAAKPGEFVVVYWTKEKAQELLALADPNADAQDPATTA